MEIKNIANLEDLKKGIEAELFNLGYKKVKSSEFDENSLNNSKIFAKTYYLGKNIYNKRQTAHFIVSRLNRKPLIILVKWQKKRGTIDEKFPFIVSNLKETISFQSLIVIDGEGYSENALNWLKNQIDEKLIEVLNFTEFQKWSKNFNV